MSASSLQLDLDVDAGRQVQAHQRVHGLRRGVENVDEPLVRAHLEVLPAVLVLVWRADHAVHVLLGRQRHRARDLGARPGHRVDDLARRAVDDLVVVGLEPDADLLSRHGGFGVLRLAAAGSGRWVPCPVSTATAARAGGVAVLTAELLVDLDDPTGAHGAAALADGEAQALLHGDRLDQGDAHLGVVTGHDHLDAFGQSDDAGDVGGPEVELRPVVVEERRVPATLVLAQDVNLGLELLVRGDRTRLADDLPALDLLALDAAQQQADVVAGAALVEQLAKHLDTGDLRALDLLLDADDLDRLADLYHAALDPTVDHGAAAGDGEDVFDRHQERLVDVALGLRDGGVTGVHQLEDGAGPLGVALERLERRAADHRKVVARELIVREQLANLELDQLEDLLVIDHVGLVEEDHDVGHANLTGQQHVLLGLRHRAVGRRDHQDGAVHLRRAGDHVLDVVGVAGAVDVGVVPIVGLVLHVRDGDRDSPGLLLRRLVDLVERREGVELGVRVVQNLGDGRGQRGLAVVDVTDGADVDVRLGPLELRLRHLCPPRDYGSYAVRRICWSVGGLTTGMSFSLFVPLRCVHDSAREPVRWRSLSVCLRDDLLRDVARDLGVGVELHGVTGPALGLAAQVADVTEHLRQRHQRPHHPRAGALVHGLNMTAAGVQVADHVAHEVLGHGDLDGHHGLHQHRVRLAGGFLERHRAGDLERHLGGIHVVVGAVPQGHLEVHQRIAGQHAELHRLLAAGIHRRDVLARDPPPGDGVDELVPAAVAAAGLEVDDHVPVLAAAAGLLGVLEVDLLHLAADGLPVGHLRFADVGLDLELPAHPVHQHVEVQFAHAGDDRLPGLLVLADLEGRVLLGQALDRGTELFLVGLRLRLDRDVDDRSRETHRLQDHRLLRVAEGVAGGGVLQADHRDDLASVDAGALLPVVGVHLHDLADALLLVLGGVEHRRAGMQPAGVHPDVGQLPKVLVSHALERQRGERLLLAGMADDLGPLVAHRVSGDRPDVERAGQELHHGVEHGLNALVLERGAAEHGGELAGHRGPPDRRHQLVVVGRLSLEVLLHDRIVVVGEGLEHLLPPLQGGFKVIVRDRDDVELVALALGLPQQGVHVDQVDDAAEVALHAPRQLDDQRYGVQPANQHVYRAVELRADAVHLVDEADPRYAVTVRLAPHRLRLRLNAGNGVEYGDCPVEDPQRSLHFDGEVDVTRRVDDVDGVVPPGAGGGGGGDGDAALLLLRHPVHRRGALVHFADLVVDAGVEQDALGGRGLARVDVRHDPDVPGPGELADDVCHGDDSSVGLCVGHSCGGPDLGYQR